MKDLSFTNRPLTDDILYVYPSVGTVLEIHHDNKVIRCVKLATIPAARVSSACWPYGLHAYLESLGYSFGPYAL